MTQSSSPQGAVCELCKAGIARNGKAHFCDGNFIGWCKGLPEPVAEPASTGEPPLDRTTAVEVTSEIEFMAARPPEPSGPPCPKCTKPMRQVGSKAPYTCWTCNCESSPKEVAEQSAEPSASSEPEKMGTCQAQDTLHKKAGICIDWKPSAAPQPVSEADDPEHPIVGPEDGNPCCEHCAKHPGWQWALGVDQPVSGDAPKVEEIALDHAGHCVVCRRAIRCEYKHVKSGHDETCVVGKILSALRSFIPASTTPQTQTCPRCEGHCHVYDYEAMAGPAQDFSRSFDQDAYVIPCPACQGSGRINL